MGKLSATWHPTLNDAKKMEDQSPQLSRASKIERQALDAAFGPRSGSKSQSPDAASDSK